jgi:hypothetical protein
MRHGDEPHSVSVAQLKAALNSTVYYFTRPVIPKNISNGDSFAFTQPVFGDASLTKKLGVLRSTAILNSVNKNNQWLNIASELEVNNPKIGPMHASINYLNPVKPHGNFWYANLVASAGPQLSTCTVGTSSMSLIKNGIIRTQLHSLPSILT